MIANEYEISEVKDWGMDIPNFDEIEQIENQGDTEEESDPETCKHCGKVFS